MAYDIPDSIKFCPKCGKKLQALVNDMVKTTECRECGESNVLLGIHCGSFCVHCGHAVLKPTGNGEPFEGNA